VDEGGVAVILSAEQQAAVEAIEGAIGKRELFALHGLAGTGKTTVAAYVAARWPGARLCALTGKAASVLRAKTGLPATTVHAAFYDFVRRDDETLVFTPRWAPSALRGEVVLIDECSMIPKLMAQDILETGVTMIAIGDPGQLPPVSGFPFS
jgi:exodeoxyribonuclease-5